MGYDVYAGVKLNSFIRLWGKSKATVGAIYFHCLYLYNYHSYEQAKSSEDLEIRDGFTSFDF